MSKSKNKSQSQWLVGGCLLVKISVNYRFLLAWSGSLFSPSNKFSNEGRLLFFRPLS